MEKDTIIQVIPCVRPMYAIYWNECAKGCMTTERIDYLGLLSNGLVVGLSCVDGWLERCDNAYNFDGLFTKEQWKIERKKRFVRRAK